MKRFYESVLLAIGVVLIFSANALAAGGSVKIGFFDLQAAITQSETGKRFLEDMKKKEEGLSASMEEKGRSFVSLKDDYEKKKDVMDEKTRSRKEKELTELYAEVQKLRAESNSKLQEEVTAARAPIIKRVYDIANRIGRDDKYDFIVEKSVLYFVGNDKDDLTKRITSELDKSH